MFKLKHAKRKLLYYKCLQLNMLEWKAFKIEVLRSSKNDKHCKTDKTAAFIYTFKAYQNFQKIGNLLNYNYINP